MITELDEAILHSQEVAENWKSQLVNCVSEEGRNKCLECVKYHEQLANWLTELKERRERDRWISVSEKLPDKEGCYIVSTDYGDVTMCIFVKGIFFLNLGNVTAWRPLPEPYIKPLPDYADKYIREKLGESEEEND